MTVLIELVKLSNPGRSSVLSVRIKATNVLAENRCFLLREAVGQLQCIYHPHRLSLIQVKADMEKLFVIEESDFCCKYFQSVIEARMDIFKTRRLWSYGVVSSLYTKLKQHLLSHKNSWALKRMLLRGPRDNSRVFLFKPALVKEEAKDEFTQLGR